MKIDDLVCFPKPSNAVPRPDEQRHGGDDNIRSKIQNALAMAAVTLPRSKRISLSSADEVRERRHRTSRQSGHRNPSADRSGSHLNQLAPRLRNFPLRMAQSPAFLRSLVQFHSPTRRLIAPSEITRRQKKTRWRLGLGFVWYNL